MKVKWKTMIKIQKMSINEIKNVNLIGHIGGPSRIKNEFPKTFGKKKPKYEPKETKIEQLGNIGI